MVTGEGLQLMKVEGQGRVYLADAGKQVTLVRLAGESIFVNGNDVLAFETGIESKITMMKKVAGMLSGGLFNIKLSGHGIVAMTSHYEPLTLPVTAQGGSGVHRSERDGGLVGVAGAGDRGGYFAGDVGGAWLGRERCRCVLRARAGWWCSLTRK